MQDLIERIVAETGLQEARAGKAVGIVLSLIKTQGDQRKVGELFSRLPGADELVVRHGSDGARGGGLLGLLGGGLMGGPLAAVAKLQAAGLSMEEIQALGQQVLAYARERAGDQLVREVAGSIPGLSRYL